jgi:hypothetical protein
MNSFFVVIRDCKLAERRDLGFYGEVFISASMSNLQEDGYKAKVTLRVSGHLKF